MPSFPVTPHDLASHFEEAARTLSRLPHHRPGGYRSSVLTVLPEKDHAETTASSRSRLPPPGAAQISRMDEALEWILWLDESERKLVWARALGMSWRMVCWRLGCSRTTAWRNWTAALQKICRRLNADASSSAT